MGNGTGDCHRWWLGACVDFAQVKISKLPPVPSGRADGRKNCARMAAEENKKHPRYSARVSKVFLQWRLQTAHENVVVNGGRLHVQLLIRSHLHKPKDLRDIV